MPFITTSVGGDGSGLPGPQGEPGNDGLNGAGFDPQPLVKSNLDPNVGASMTLVGPDNPFTGAWSVGSYVRVINSVNTEEFFEGTITDFTSGGLTVTILISYVTDTWTREGSTDVWTMTLAGDRGAGTGEITFNGVQIIGAGTASGDGSNLGTIELVPDADLLTGQYPTEQYLIIDPTSPNHIHIRAGGQQDNSTAHLYLGAEKNNIEVSDPYRTVKINTRPQGIVNTYGNSNQASNTEFMVVSDTDIMVGDTVRLYTGGPTYIVTAVTQEYPYAGLMTVVADGLSFVTGESYTFTREAPYNNQWSFGDGLIYFPNGSVMETPVNEGTVAMYANYSVTGNGGHFEIGAGNAIGDNKTGGTLNIIGGGAGGYNGTGGNVTVEATSGGKILLTGNGGEFLNDMSIPANQIAKLGDLPTGATGTFQTPDSQLVVVTNGIITSIESLT